VTGALLLVAAGGLARETAQAAAAGGVDVLGYLDDDPAMVGVELDGAPVLGSSVSVGRYAEASLVLCAGRGAVREQLARRLAEHGAGDERYARVVHPSVQLAATCEVATGSILLAGVVLTASVRVGRHVVVMPHVTLTHDDVVADYATLCAGVQLGGAVSIGRGAYLGMGAVVREGVSVGEGAVVGMGSVLTRDVPPGQTWWGVPARQQAERALRAASPS
jgi:sugar O-acyltransferase (sialic acid O-acetyltransferase NeuD family)